MVNAASTSLRQLRFEGVSKRFPGVRALEGVSLEARGGSVHALLGENGAGKSTLLKILSGAIRADEGRVVVDGIAQTFSSTAAALRAGVAVIYQELHLVGELSVAENLFLGHLPQTGGWVHTAKLREAAREVLGRLGEEIDPRRKISSLPIAQRQMVEIAKALTRDARVLAFDEPTSSLSAREVDRLFDVIAKLRDQGRVILYVTHRMEEVFRLCDAATVLRDGRHVETFETLKGVQPGELVGKMVGRRIEDVFHHEGRKVEKAAERPVLEVRGLCGHGIAEGASLEVGAGEVVGIFGLVGAGRTELLRLIYGAERAQGGEVLVRGQRVAIRSPRHAVRAGVVLCPEDRKKDGIVGIRSVMENINISARRHFSRMGFFIHGTRERENAAGLVGRLGIKTPSLGQLMMNLSGGNQQKAILARWLGEQVKVVLLDEPTRGIDVGAKSEIYSIIDDLARRGIGVVAVSSELPEVMGISDRLLVMRQGRIVAEIRRGSAEFLPERILQLALPVAATDYE